MPYAPRPYVPDVDTTPRPLPPSLLAVTCAEAFGWWIECRCSAPGCHGSLTHYPVRLLIQRYHCGPRRLLDVAARLRCGRCHIPPSSLSLIDDVQRVPKPGMRLPGNAPVATVIDLLPYLAAQARGATAALPVTRTTWLVPFTATDLERDPAKRRLLEETFALHGVEGGPLLGADRGDGGGELGVRKG